MDRATGTAGLDVGRRLDDPVTIALAVLIDRVRRLPVEDRDDLFELVQELPKAASEEDRGEIYRTMREILAQEVLAARSLDLASDDPPGPRLRAWIDLVGGRVRAAREASGLTQAELAGRSGLPQSHISRIENGKLSPSRATLEKLAAGLGRPLSEFDPLA